MGGGRGLTGSELASDIHAAIARFTIHACDNVMHFGRESW